MSNIEGNRKTKTMEGHGTLENILLIYGEQVNLLQGKNIISTARRTSAIRISNISHAFEAVCSEHGVCA